MAKSEKIKSITYMKTNAADILSEVSESKRPFIITHNGEGKIVIQDLNSYEEMKDSIVMLKLVAQGRQSADRGKAKPARFAFDAIARRRRRHGGKVHVVGIFGGRGDLEDFLSDRLLR